ncbi:dTDP-4-amino-4,6-dideoxygalactose transaminase [Streptacidiphilus sp. MAP12-33]
MGSVGDRTAILRERFNIGTSQRFRPVHELGLYQQPPTRPLCITEAAARRQLSLRCFPDMSPRR